MSYAGSISTRLLPIRGCPDACLPSPRGRAHTCGEAAGWAVCRSPHRLGRRRPAVPACRTATAGFAAVEAGNGEQSMGEKSHGGRRGQDFSGGRRGRERKPALAVLLEAVGRASAGAASLRGPAPRGAPRSGRRRRVPRREHAHRRRECGWRRCYVATCISTKTVSTGKTAAHLALVTTSDSHM